MLKTIGMIILMLLAVIGAHLVMWVIGLGLYNYSKYLSELPYEERIQEMMGWDMEEIWHDEFGGW